MPDARNPGADLTLVDDHRIRREAEWLRAQGRSDVARLLEHLWERASGRTVSHARALTDAPERRACIATELPDLATPILGCPHLSISYLRSIHRATEDPETPVYMPVVEGGARHGGRYIRVGTLGHLQELAAVALDRIAGSTLVCDILSEDSERKNDGIEADARHL